METVTCPSCGEENPARFRMCGICGTPLGQPAATTVACPSCGEENPARFRMCGICGTPLHPATDGGGAVGPGEAIRALAGEPIAAPPPAPSPAPAPAAPGRDIRKVVTIIFTDLKDSTALAERVDAEAVNELKERYFATVTEQIEQHGGRVEKYIGDAIMAVFGLPRAREDDALRAVRAAHGMVVALERLNDELELEYGVRIGNRTGVNTGEVVANTDPTAQQRLATGDAVNVAARLEQAAPVNEVLIGEVTYALVRNHVDAEAVEPLTLKGKSEPVPAYRLVGLSAQGRGDARPSADLPLIGREPQLQALRDSLASVVRDGGSRLVVVTGEAGVGKKHLIDAFHRDVGETVTVLQGRCLPYGDGITFWPLFGIARGAAGIVDDDPPERARAKLAEAIAGAPGADEVVERLASIMGLGSGAFPLQELFWGARRYLEALATRRPVVAVIEDAHHAQSTFLDLLDDVLASTGPKASLLVLVTARPTIFDARPAWTDHPQTETVELPPLDSEDTGRLVEALLGGPVQASVKERIAAAAEGNPLFVAQLASLFVDNGLLERRGDAWVATGDLASAKVPPTLQALLAARLDDLSSEERAVLEPASVMGLSFPEPAVSELVPAEIVSRVPECLAALDRKQFIDRVENQTGEDRIFRFRNQLIRDATYGSLLKRSRAQLHERFVTWAERVNRERGREEEFEELNGYHLEQAYRYRLELGPLDAHGRELAERAAVKLSNAGRRAFARSDIPAAVGLLRRAADLSETEMPGRVELLGELGEALVVQGSFDQAATVLDGAAGDARSIGDECLIARVRVTRLMLGLYVKEEEESATASIAAAEDVIRTFEAHEDDEGLARAWRIVMANQFTLGNLDQAGLAAEQVVEHAVRAGDQRLASRSAPAVAYVMVHGPTPVDEAIRRCEELFDGLRGDRRNEAIVLAALAQLKAMQGEFDEARTLYRRGKAILDELDTGLTARNTSIDSHRVELLAGDPDAAIAELRRDDLALAELGESYFRSTVTAVLANVLAAQGELDEALGSSEVAQRLADEDDAWSQAAWRTARAQVLVARGDPAEAGRLADEAAALVRSSEDLLVRVDTLEAVASILERIGRPEEAEATLGEVLALHEAKMDIVSARRVRERLAASRVA